MPEAYQDTGGTFVSEKKEARAGIQECRPTVWIGKLGITPAVQDEIRVQLEKRGLIKVKVLPSATVEPGDIATISGARLVAVRGRMVVLEKRSRRTSKP